MSGHVDVGTLVPCIAQEDPLLFPDQYAPVLPDQYVSVLQALPCTDPGQANVEYSVLVYEFIVVSYIIPARGR